MKLCALLAPICLSLALGACQTVPTFTPQQLEARRAMQERIAQEPAGQYFVGRRYYKTDYKMWGYVRKPGEPWSDSRLVMLNENQTLAPDRAARAMGSDNGFEYRLLGHFSGETVYEPASNEFYPEFVLKRAELQTNAPAPIFLNPKALDPNERYYPSPF